MYLINHFLDQLVLGQPVPYIAKLNQTNAASGPGSLGTQVETCVASNGRPPNFLLVDVGLKSFLWFQYLTPFPVLRIWRWFCFPSCRRHKWCYLFSGYTSSKPCYIRDGNW